MYVELSEKEVKTRKDHRCEWCDEPIPAKSRSHYRDYLWEDTIRHGWMHLECWSAMNQCDDLTEGWEPGDYERGTTECSEQR